MFSTGIMRGLWNSAIRSRQTAGGGSSPFAVGKHPAAEDSPIRSLCDFLSGASDSPLLRYTPQGADPDRIIDFRAVFQQHFRDLAPDDLPDLLLPRKGRLGLVDYEKAFCADHRKADDLFDRRGVDRNRGCLVVVRPDQYVAHVLPLEGNAELAAFFGAFMLPATQRKAAAAHV